MANKNLWLERFTPDAEYEARKVLKLGRKLLHPGQRVPKGTFSDRRMRQLYDARYIVMVKNDEIAETIEPKTEDVEPKAVSNEDVTPVADDATTDVGNSEYTIEQRGPAWVAIVKNGEQIGNVMRRKEAEEKLAELNE